MTKPDQKIEPGILVSNKSELRLDISEHRSNVASGVGDVIAFCIPAGTTGIVLGPETAPVPEGLSWITNEQISGKQIGWRVSFRTHCGPFTLELERVLQDRDLLVLEAQETANGTD